MIESWKSYRTFMDKANIITKLFLGIALFVFVIFVHNFDTMLYLVSLMFLLTLILSGAKFRVLFIFLTLSTLFAISSSLFMIFYGNGHHELFKIGFIRITEESLVRGLHLSLRTLVISFFGLAIAFTSQVIMIFYSFMQHLRVKPKIAYTFMAAFRMLPLIMESFIQLRHALKMRYQMIQKSHYRGTKRFYHILIPLLSQNMRKAHRLSVAMEMKGFKDGPRTYYYDAPFSYRDILLIVSIIGVVLCALMLSHYIPITGITDVR
ncbi:energy-coupling factor transporter transmembrane component T family protein [Staphylococcus agnetis]|uniref:energy-coupling factor transporter transmembrane component T family protein n=1 Tax=Staphylococcus agnetis TaxID=985762 RepID=UPI0004E383B4|nr:energy-coupling factor transporter transmembrane component T [Staphylococcus agnetis]KFE41852.1 cobalt ABC transporter permease [Staphylococcus agnetis]NJH65939.1 energy-coupling factor transporter transmembrane protein EcfT [Staphylococcus agnetis]NJH98281.1 energy-coupling factor transporter transmembrane protein EcfT [Staphylococcus agnetis]PTH49085.1 energy-coupling factor transporter transmembrane protein EcfT [Staphylococcus agnetis]PTH73628.1 energy-coupling factor transporter transm